jgi:ABC-type Mn2+/Zn2+ transport system permease subunit
VKEKEEERENMIFVLINILVAKVAATMSATCVIRRWLLYHKAMSRSPFSIQ